MDLVVGIGGDTGAFRISPTRIKQASTINKVNIPSQFKDIQSFY